MGVAVSVAILVVTDGRDDYLGQTVAALEANVTGPITERWMFDDVGNERHVRKLADWYPQYRVFGAQRRLGFGGAIAYAWNMLAEASDASWVLHVEDDQLVTRPVDLADLIGLSEAQPHLAQVALRRQAWNAEERAAGGFIEAAPGWYTERTEGGYTWVETTRNWTTNVSLYRRDLCALGWPDGVASEGRYGFQLRERGLPWGIPGDDVRFGFWGGLESGREWIRHIGEHRAGTGY